MELRKLEVTPQTVFLKSRGPDASAPLRSSGSRKVTPIMSPVPHLRRNASADFTPQGGAAFDDLRRRLAAINGSASSLSIAHSPRESRAPASPLIPHSPSSTSIAAVMSPNIDRPPSPTESVLSTANSSNFRPSSRLQVGSMDGQKAAPAVGSFRTNVAGVLDTHAKLRSDGSPERSGRSSPLSMSATIRMPLAVHAPLPHSVRISSYGKFDEVIICT